MTKYIKYDDRDEVIVRPKSKVKQPPHPGVKKVLTSTTLKGKPLGTKSRATQALLIIGEASCKEIYEKAVELAMNGCTASIKLLLDRVSPVPRGRLINIDLPRV